MIKVCTPFLTLLITLELFPKFTPVAKILSSLGKICCRAGSETFLKMETLSVKTRAYPREIKTSAMNFENVNISPL